MRAPAASASKRTWAGERQQQTLSVDVFIVRSRGRAARHRRHLHTHPISISSAHESPATTSSVGGAAFNAKARSGGGGGLSGLHVMTLRRLRVKRISVNVAVAPRVCSAADIMRSACGGHSLYRSMEP